MLIKILFLFCTIIFLNSCLDKTEVKRIRHNNPIDFKQSRVLKLSKKIKIKLDSLTPQPYGDIQVYVDTSKHKNYLHFLNYNNLQIYFYDLATKELAFTVKLAKEGENGVGKNIRGYIIKNLDSIFIYNYPTELSLVNLKAKKIASYRVLGNLETDTLLIFPNIQIGSSSPIIFKKNLLIMNGYMSGELEKENNYNRPFVIFYNLQNQKLAYGANYTNSYQNANWGGDKLRHTYAAYNPDKDIIIYSLPIEHHLYVSSDGKKLEKYFAGSKYFDEIISLNKSKTAYLNMNEVYAVYAERPSYSSIIYDKFRKIYYRFAELPIDKFDEKGGAKTTLKKVSIIILDENFNYLGETLMPHNLYFFNTFFVCEDGIGFVRYSNKEDEATFDVFKVIEKNEK